MSKINPRIILFVLLSAMSTALLSRSTSALEIQWEVKKPFRFFKYSSDFEIHRWAYLTLKSEKPGPEPTILDMEHLLSDPAWWTKKLPREITVRFRKSEDTTALGLLTELRANEIKEEGRRPGYLELTSKVFPELSQEAGEALKREYDFRRLGWASLLFPSHQRPNLDEASRPALVEAENVAVCWNRAEQRHSNCPNYVLPKSYDVVLQLADLANNPAPAAQCTWRAGQSAGFQFRLDPSSPTITANCDEQIEATILAGIKATITVEAEGSSSASVDVEVKDTLVVGLGDSFSSGEGNPDVPAKMKWTPYKDQDPLVADSTVTASEPGYIPLRKADGDYFAAQWIDRACHRSAYSYQLRTAIQLAIHNPRAAVTFLGYACSGAEINEGLFNPFMGPEIVGPKGRMAPFERAQIPLLFAELCIKYSGDSVRPRPISPEEEDRLIRTGQYRIQSKGGAVGDLSHRCRGAQLGEGFKRPIDLLMLSIGGNDAGFARWITAAITPKSLWSLANAFLPVLNDNARACSDDYSCRIMTKRWKRLAARYALLRQFLDQRLPIRKTPMPILIYTYPIGARDITGNYCPGGNSGMTVWGLRSICIRDDQISGGTLPYIEEFATSMLNNKVADFSSGNGAADTYVLVNDYVPEFMQRSFCATTLSNSATSEVAPEPAKQCYSLRDIIALMNSDKIPRYIGKSAAETLHLPRLSGQSEWRPFDPVLGFEPYRSRQRWMRTMNDVYLLINQQKWATRLSPGQVLSSFTQSAIYGAFHPTAESHARIATSFAAAATQLLAH